jgi:pancreatic triacylglycerol lipase
MFGKIGNATFFPNGGKFQPGCTGRINKYRCAHKRAYYLFAESVKKDESQFVAEKCANITDIAENECHKDKTEVRMGGEPSNFAKAVRGVYMLFTHPKSPFAWGNPIGN